MKYQIGDIVLLLHSNEEGRIVDLINDQMLMVDVKGVTFPVYKDQVDFPYFKRFSEKKIFSTKKEKKYIDDVRKEKPEIEPRTEDGAWLTFLPVMDTDEFGDVVVEELKLHLVNHTRTAYNFIYKLHFFGKPDFELKNTIQPFEDFYLHDIEFASLNDSPSFDFEFSLLQPAKHKEAHYETSVRLKPKQLFAKIEELKQKNLATFSQLLFENYPDKVHEDKVEMGKLAAKGYKIYEASEARKHLEPARSVVDLHIEKLTDNWRRMSNYEFKGSSFTQNKKSSEPSGTKLVVLPSDFLITMLFKCTNKVLGNYLCRPALYLVSFNKMNQLPVFKQSYGR